MEAMVWGYLTPRAQKAQRGLMLLSCFTRVRSSDSTLAMAEADDGRHENAKATFLSSMSRNRVLILLLGMEDLKKIKKSNNKSQNARQDILGNYTT